MSTLIVVGFKKDMYRASSVLNQLLEMDYDWTVDLRDAVAVYRDYSGKLRVDQSYQLTTGEGAAVGGLFGSLIGLTVGAIAAPFTAGASRIAADCGRRRGRWCYRRGGWGAGCQMVEGRLWHSRRFCRRCGNPGATG